MIETAYVKDGWLKAVVNGSERTITFLSGSDRLEGFTSAGVTYVKDGWRKLWSADGSERTICYV